MIRLIRWLVFTALLLTAGAFALLYFRPWNVNVRHSEIKQVLFYKNETELKANNPERTLDVKFNKSFDVLISAVSFRRSLTESKSKDERIIVIVYGSENKKTYISNKYVIYNFHNDKEAKKYKIKVNSELFNALYDFAK